MFFHFFIKGCKVNFYKDRGSILNEFFDEETDGDDSYVYLKDLDGFFRKWFQIEFNSDEWRLFIDASMNSLKVVLLHCDDLPEVPLFYSRTLRESYSTMKLVLDKIKYQNYGLFVCADLKVLNMLRGIKPGNVSYPCLKCLWDSRSYSTHYSNKKCVSRDSLDRNEMANPKKKRKTDQSAEEFSESLAPLVDPKKLMLPPLHIKLGLFSQLVKSIFKKGGPSNQIMQLRDELEEDEELFNHLYEINDEGLDSLDLNEDDEEEDDQDAEKLLKEMKCENIGNEYKQLVIFLKKTFKYKSAEKIKKGIFNGPEIRKLIKLRSSFEKVQPTQFKKAWSSYVAVVENFLGNNRATSYKKDCRELIVNYCNQGCLMSVKLHYIDQHVDDFPENCGKLGEESGERFHQDIKLCEDKFSQYYNKAMIMDYCWFLIDEKEEQIVRRRTFKRRSFEHQY